MKIIFIIYLNIKIRNSKNMGKFNSIIRINFIILMYTKSTFLLFEKEIFFMPRSQKNDNFIKNIRFLDY